MIAFKLPKNSRTTVSLNSDLESHFFLHVGICNKCIISKVYLKCWEDFISWIKKIKHWPHSDAIDSEGGGINLNDWKISCWFVKHSSKKRRIRTEHNVNFTGIRSYYVHLFMWLWNIDKIFVLNVQKIRLARLCFRGAARITFVLIEYISNFWVLFEWNFRYY